MSFCTKEELDQAAYIANEARNTLNAAGFRGEVIAIALSDMMHRGMVIDEWATRNGVLMEKVATLQAELEDLRSIGLGVWQTLDKRIRDDHDAECPSHSRADGSGCNCRVLFLRLLIEACWGKPGAASRE